MPFQRPESEGDEPPALSVAAGDYDVAAHFEHTVAADGVRTYCCRLIATPLAGHGDRAVVERTLVMSQDDAIQGNGARPGTMPPPDQLNAGMAALGMRYIQMLIEALNRGQGDLALTGRRSVSEVRSRIGMTDGALRARERS